jgi:hypothetical protein
MAQPTQAAMSVYDSVPLPLGDNVYIRVMRIRPSADTERIACDFSILDVDDMSLFDLNTALPLEGSCQYTALSYMWGQTIADHTINLNGTPFLVRKNLWDFLRQARIDRLEGYLWIDALCIDQSSIGERSHQVALMGKIYSHAQGVVVWLGRNDEHIENAMAVINQAHSSGYDCSFGSSIYRSKGLRDFCKLQYWSRAWV